MPLSELIIRQAEDSDAEGLINMIEGCFHEYDGCVMDVDGVDAGLKAIKSYVEAADGEFWVVVDGGQVVASVGYMCHGTNQVELVRMYVDKNYRRMGLASKLLSLVRDAAKRRGAKIDMWSDTRFVEAHAFYIYHGYAKQDETRELNDPSNTLEFHFIET